MIHPMEASPNILIIDDDQGVRNTYGKIFSPAVARRVFSQGRTLFNTPGGATGSPRPRYQVTLAENGLEGIQHLSKALASNQPYAVAFIDMKMPGLNGAETARRIWELDPDIKIVIVTAYSEHSPEDIVQITERDDIFYLRKPFNPEEISQFARALVNAWNLERKREALENQLQAANTRLATMNQNLQQKVTEQATMVIQSEKMASVGILAAGVAHEINNPIAFINANLEALREYTHRITRYHSGLDKLQGHLGAKGPPGTDTIIKEWEDLKKTEKINMILADLQDLISESIDGVHRVRTIVKDLKSFSRIDDGEFREADINHLMDTTLNMARTKYKHRAVVEKEYGEFAPIRCYPQKLSQVFMNLIINAAQAIETQGTISISTRRIPSTALSPSQTKAIAVARGNRGGQGAHDAYVEITITDSGPGISPGDMARLFDPFFTTKPVGEGTGLGLSIAYEIIKAHGGHISAVNTRDSGACFTIVLPAVNGGRP